MKRLTPAKFLATAALALGAFGAASAAHARSDVYFSIGVQGAPGFYVEPAPVYVQPRPVYVQPRPVYVQPPVYAGPTEVYVNPERPVYGYSYEDQRDWRQAEWRRRNWRHHHEWDQHRSHDRDWD
jgi:hypothetical protein